MCMARTSLGMVVVGECEVGQCVRYSTCSCCMLCAFAK